MVNADSQRPQAELEFPLALRRPRRFPMTRCSASVSERVTAERMRLMPDQLRPYRCNPEPVILVSQSCATHSRSDVFRNGLADEAQAHRGWSASTGLYLLPRPCAALGTGQQQSRAVPGDSRGQAGFLLIERFRRASRRTGKPPRSDKGVRGSNPRSPTSRPCGRAPARGPGVKTLTPRRASMSRSKESSTLPR